MPGRPFSKLTAEERAARNTLRALRVPLPPMNQDLGRPSEEKKARGKYKTKAKHAFTLIAEVNQSALERIAADFLRHPTKKTPLEVLVDLAADVNASNNQRKEAAAAAAPYLHKKMNPFNDDQAPETASKAPPIINIVEVQNNSPEIRAELEAELEAAIKSAGKGGA